MINPTPTGLRPLAGAPDWESFQGNQAHTGYVPVTLDATKFSTRWRRTLLINPRDSLNRNVAVSEGRIIVSGMRSLAGFVAAYAEADGNDVLNWGGSFGAGNAGSPTVSGGRAYVGSDGGGGAFIWNFNLSSGAQAWRTELTSKPVDPFVPVVSDGTVYGGSSAVDVESGLVRWSVPAAQRPDETTLISWSPVVDSDHVYTAIAGLFNAYSRANGSIVYSLGLPGAINLSIDPPALADGSHVIIHTAKTLTVIDLDKRRVAWSLAADTAYPAIAKGIVYVANNSSGAIEQYALADGSRLRSIAYPEKANLAGNMIVTDNLLFASQATGTEPQGKTFAIDPTSGKVAWSHDAAGSLALSANGLLLIVNDAAVTAINLH